MGAEQLDDGLAGRKSAAVPGGGTAAGPGGVEPSDRSGAKKESGKSAGRGRRRDGHCSTGASGGRAQVSGRESDADARGTVPGVRTDARTGVGRTGQSSRRRRGEKRSSPAAAAAAAGSHAGPAAAAGSPEGSSRPT